MDGVGAAAGDDVLDEADHRAGDAQTGDENRDAGRIRDEELAGDSALALRERDELAVAEGGVAGEDDRLAGDGAFESLGIGGGMLGVTDGVAHLADATEEVFEVFAHGADGDQEEDGDGGCLFPLDVGVVEQLAEGVAGGRVAEGEDHLQRVMEVAAVLPLGVVADDGAQPHEAFMDGPPDEVGHAPLKVGHPVEALFDEAEPGEVECQ